MVLDPWTLESKGEIAVGEHPNAMVASRDGSRLFVACANTNAVWVVDLAKRMAGEQIAVALGLDAPVGSTPNAVALSPDGRTLLVATRTTTPSPLPTYRNPARPPCRAGFRSAGIRPRCSSIAIRDASSCSTARG
jgi:sugar lactone lactonase YvrE